MLRALLVATFGLGLGLGLAGCAGYSKSGMATVEPGYVTGGGEWNTGGGITTAVRVLEDDGATVVCGAWAASRQSVLTHGLNEGVMEAGSVYLDGHRLVQNLRFMSEAGSPDELLGAPAACVRSSTPWQAGFAESRPRVRFPRIVHTEVADEEGGGGSSLVFREVPRADVLG